MYSQKIPTRIKNRYSDTLITLQPSINEIKLAATSLNQARLRLYQLLYSVGLTNPSGGKWKAQIPINYDSVCSYLIAVGNDGCSEVTVSGETADEVYLKVIQIENARLSGKTRVRPTACCILAEVNPCVCIESFTCPIHGTQCRGSHD